MRDPFAPQPFTYRQTLTLALVLVLGAVLVPTGVNAQKVGSVFRLQDADSGVLAQVDSGEVRVGDGSGALTVDGNVGITPKQSTVQIGAHEPYAQSGSVTFQSGATFNGGTVYTVPNGKRFVLETLSVEAQLPDGQRAEAQFRILGPSAGDIATFHLPLLFELDTGTHDLFAATQEVNGYGAPGAQLTVSGQRSSATGVGELRYSFTGHLVPA